MDMGPLWWDDNGCYEGEGPATMPAPENPDFTMEQQENRIVVTDSFGSWGGTSSSGYGSAAEGTVEDDEFRLSASFERASMQFRGRISEDGRTIRGRASCRVGSNSALPDLSLGSIIGLITGSSEGTATVDFTFTRQTSEETRLVRIWLTGFIPTPIADIMLPAGPLQCSHGDGRSFSSDRNETRYRFRQLIEFEVNLQEEHISEIKILTNEQDVQRSYLVECNNPRQVLDYGDSPDRPQFTYELIENRAIRIRFTGQLRHGVLRQAAPAIDYDIEAILDPINETVVSVTGIRNHYPAYEMYASFQDQGRPETSPITLLQSMPDGLTRTPLDLIGGPDTPVTDYGEQGRNAGDWSSDGAAQDAVEDIFSRPTPQPSPTPSFDGFGGGDSGGAGAGGLW
jgi:hypothetical protein